MSNRFANEIALRLFDVDGPPPIAPLTATPAPNGNVSVGQAAFLDKDGLLARPVQPHSRDKAYYASRYADVVGNAMHSKFNERWWVELFAGPGRLYVTPSEEFVDGSPLEALRIRKPFTGYIFADLHAKSVDALKSRIRARGHSAHILLGDANDPVLHERILDLIPEGALVVLYLDPEGLELEFNTIRTFASRVKALDLLVNFPVNAVVRYLCAGHSDKVSRMLDYPDPQRLRREADSHGAVRNAFEEKIAKLGFGHITRRQVRAAQTQSPQYDLILASRNPTAAKLFNKVNAIDPDGQRQLGLGF
jgi:three-Cys-motif partner protein